jgi:hypothetical protein
MVTYRVRRLPAPVRAARGAALAATTASLGVAGHVLAGGEVPDAGLTILVAALVGWAGAVVVDRARGTLATVAALVAGQLVLHVVLSLPSALAHLHPSEVLPELSANAWVGAHILVVLGVGLVLAGADAAILVALQAISTTLRQITRPLPACAPLWIPVLPSQTVDVERDILLRRLRARRGPPVCA